MASNSSGSGGAGMAGGGKVGGAGMVGGASKGGFGGGADPGYTYLGNDGMSHTANVPTYLGDDGKRHVVPYGKRGSFGGVGNMAGGGTNNGKNSFLGGAEKRAENMGVGGAAGAGTYANELNERENEDGPINSVEGKGDDGSSEGEDVNDEGNIFKPLFSIIGCILGFAFLTLTSQLTQPFSLVEAFRTNFNTMQVSASLRSHYTLRYQLNNRLMRNPIRAGLFGRNATFKVSEKQKSKLSNEGIRTISVDESGQVVDSNSTNRNTTTFFAYESDGQTKYVVADAGDSDAVRNYMIRQGLDMEYENGGPRINTFMEAFDNDDTFFKKFKAGSLTWRGAIAGWFQDTTLKFLVNNKLTRNLFSTYIDKVQDSDGDAKAAMIDLVAEGTERVQDGGVEASTLKDSVDDDGRSTGAAGTSEHIETEGEGRRVGAGVINTGEIRSVDDVKAEIEEVRNKYGKSDVSGGGFLGAAQQAANYTCLAATFLGGVSLLVSATEAIKMIHIVTAFFEAVDKTKAGYGDEAPLNEFTDALNSPTPSNMVTLATQDNYEAVGESIGNAISTLGGETPNTTYDADTVNGYNARQEQLNNEYVSSIRIQNRTSTGSAMDSSPILSMFSGQKIDPYDPAVMSFNLSAHFKTLLGGLGVGMGSFVGCSIAKMATNALSAIETVWEIASCVAGAAGAAFSFGATLLGCLPGAISVAAGVAMSIGAGLMIAGLIQVITPLVANMMIRTVGEMIASGELFGSGMVSYAGKYIGSVHQANGGSLSTREKYVSFRAQRESAIAEDARYDRLTKSPFDASSQYTFLGTLVRQFMGFAGSNKSIMSTITSTGGALSSSITALLPSASAIDAANMLYTDETYQDICPYLSSINAVGDAYCNPYIITDVSTIADDPNDVIEELYQGNNFKEEFTEDGNVQIDPDSELARYILLDNNRTSAFGIASQDAISKIENFATAQTENTTFNNVVNSGIGAIPAVGDAIDAINNGLVLPYVGYVSGETAVAGNHLDEEYPGNAAPSWDGNGDSVPAASTYQRFIEDQTLFESEGIFEESAVSAFLDEYYEEHPLDNSYEGILARYSGMSKDEVVSFLKIIDYGNYLANYKPEERYAFAQDVKPEGADELKFNNDHKVAYVILLNTIEFADVRNRSFVV